MRITLFCTLAWFIVATAMHAEDRPDQEADFRSMQSILKNKTGDRMDVIDLAADLAVDPTAAVLLLRQKSESLVPLTRQTAILAALLFYPLANEPSPLKPDELQALNDFLQESSDLMDWATRNEEKKAASDLLLALPPRRNDDIEQADSTKGSERLNLK
jgi:hypothetical protein